MTQSPHFQKPAAKCLGVLVALTLTTIALTAGYRLIVKVRYHYYNRGSATHFVPFGDDFNPEISYVGEISPRDQPFTTYFTAPLPGLSCLAWQLGAGEHGFLSPVAWTLAQWDGAGFNERRRGLASPRGRDTEVLDAFFDPIGNSAGRRFRVTLTAADSHPLKLMLSLTSDRRVVGDISHRVNLDVAATSQAGQHSLPAAIRFDITSPEDRMDGIVVRVTDAAFRGSFVQWSLLETNVSQAPLQTAGNLSEWDTSASDEWHLRFRPIASSRGRVFRLSLDIQPGRKPFLTNSFVIHSLPHITSLIFQNPGVPEPAITALGGACYSVLEPAP